MNIKKLVQKAITPPMLFILLMIPHFKLPYFNEFDLIDLAFNGLRIVSFVITAFVFIKYREKMTKTFAALLCLQGVLAISTLVNGLSLYTFIAENLLQVAVFMLFTMFASDAKKMIKVLFLIAEILTYANLISMILFPNGMYISALLNYYHNWLLGYKNQLIVFFLNFMMISALYSRYEKNSIRPFLLDLAIMVSIILAKSVTSAMALTIFLILKIFVIYKDHKTVNSYMLTAGNIVLFFAVVVFRAFNIVSLLTSRAPITISGRTVMWDKIMELAADKPILGFGVMSSEQSVILTGLAECTIAHNTILQYLYTGGAAALILFCVFNYFIIKKLYKHRNTYTAKILSITLFVYHFATLVEVYANPLVFIIFALADNIEKMLPYEKANPGLRMKTRKQKTK